MKQFFIVDSNGEVKEILNTKKEVKKELKRIVSEEYKKWKEGSYKDYEIWSIKFDARKYYTDTRFFGEMFLMEKKTKESIDYDLWSTLGIKDKKENKDFLYCKE